MLPAALIAAAVLVPFSACMVLKSKPGEPTRRIGLIFMSLTLTLFWGPLLLRMMPELLEADAHLVAWALGGAAKGNIFTSVDGTSHFLIAPGCSSLNNISLATILTVTGSQYFQLDLDRRVFWTALLGSLATIAINVGRLATIAWRPKELNYWHHGPGSAYFAWATFLAVAVVVGISVDRMTAGARR
jgi:exosortase/archaeosortase family protein